MIASPLPSQASSSSSPSLVSRCFFMALHVSYTRENEVNYDRAITNYHNGRATLFTALPRARSELYYITLL